LLNKYSCFFIDYHLWLARVSQKHALASDRKKQEL
jgi:hypothetical protein